MDGKYHISMTTEAIGEHFSSSALKEVVKANLSQDAVYNLAGLKPYLHYDASLFDEANAYVESERTIVLTSKNPSFQRQAFGRMLHTVQDFYAHSTYVRIWLAQNGGAEKANSADIEPMVSDILMHPDLMSGDFKLAFDIFYHIPLINKLARKIYIRPNSHEELNLDGPRCGTAFAFAEAAAIKRTRLEYEQLIAQLRETKGEEAVQRFLKK